MEKGISFYFGFKNLTPEAQAKMISEAGFDRVITSRDMRFKNGTLGKQVRLFKKYNLKLSSLHFKYDPKELYLFWQLGKKGERAKRSLFKDVKLAKKYGFASVVVHLFGEYSEIGKRRLLEVLKVCEKCDVPLAIENINDQKLFLQVFENIKHPYLKFCYDSGHNNFFDKGFDYLGKFGDKLVALHLHDNDGTADMHTLNRFGNIDWKKIGKALAKANPNIVLDYEVLMKYKPEGVLPEQCLKEIKTQADELEKIILIQTKKRLD